MDYRDAIAKLEQVVRQELDREIIRGVSIALVDDQRIVFAGGFGFADVRREIPDTEQTIYRAGSVSKLFTAVAAMQQVEQGKLDLDAPLAEVNPRFSIVSPFADAAPITLRQLMCHRSGIVREAPVGGYFDNQEPTLDATVASLASCVLVNPPNTQTRYSNVGPTIVGQTIALASGKSFVDYQQEHLLGPLGMSSSAFLMNDRLRPRLAAGYLRVAQPNGGFEKIEAPEFELGTIPAGNLYTSAEDLARFLACLFAQGKSGDQRILQPKTLEEMFTVQLTEEPAGFGLGFFVNQHRGHKTVHHMGAVYGFTSSAVALPERKLGIVVLCNEDIAIGPVVRIANAARDLMLEAKLGEAPTELATATPLASEEGAALAGNFESPGYWAEIRSAGERLEGTISGQEVTLTPTEPLKFVADGRLLHQSPVVFERDAAGKVASFTAMNQKFTRVHDRAAQAPEDWRKLVGSYGPDFIPLIISVRHGHLYAMTENELDYRLTPVNRTVFRFTAGLYTDEQLVFQLGADGRVQSVILANMVLKRTSP